MRWQLILERFAYTPTEVQGRLTYGDWSCYTLERPWIPGPAPGGLPFLSCIPDGNYALVPYTRPNGDDVVCLVNDSLGVHFHEQKTGRYLCLIHSANYVSEVVGCIAPGENRLMLEGRMMVTKSRTTMSELMRLINNDGCHDIIIKRTFGARDDVTELDGGIHG